MTGEYDPKEFEEEMERVMKNMLEDMKDDAAAQLLSIDIKPHEVTVRYMLDDGKERVSNLEFVPHRYVMERK